MQKRAQIQTPWLHLSNKVHSKFQINKKPANRNKISWLFMFMGRLAKLIQFVCDAAHSSCGRAA